MGFFGCDYLESEGNFFTEYKCKYSRQILDRRTAEDICMTNKHMDCADYKNASRCFITTAVCLSLGKPDNCKELMVMRSFRDEWLRNQSGGEALIVDYYEIAPSIVELINRESDKKTVYRAIYEDYILPCVNCARTKDFLGSKKIYIEMMNALKEKYL